MPLVVRGGATTLSENRLCPTTILFAPEKARRLLEMIVPTIGARDWAMKGKNDLDQRVGERLRSRRLKMRLSQTELGAAAGVTFQQVQKYERGANRISASRMIQFAERLGVAPGGSKANGDANKTARAIESVAASNEGVAVLEATAQMKPSRRKFMVTLARALRDME
jgi:transcriptional regulator with XRE-family HTH domain